MQSSKKRGSNPFGRFLFLIYVVLMIWLLFLQRMEDGGTVVEENWNFVPFKTLKLYWDLIISKNRFYVIHSFVNLVGNVIMFIPLGLFLPLIWRKFRMFWSTVLLSLFLIVVIEALQYFTGLGSCDVDDLILNITGVVIGYYLYSFSAKKRS